VRSIKTRLIMQNCIVEYPAGLSVPLGGGDLVWYQGDETGRTEYEDGSSNLYYPADYDVGGATNIIRFNTLVLQCDGLTAENLVFPSTIDTRAFTADFYDNLWLIDTSKVNSIDVTLTGLNESFSNVDSDFRPITSISATGDSPLKDATGTDRPSNGYSIGALEPTG